MKVQTVMTDSVDQLFTPADVMRLCSISRTTFWRWENVHGLKVVNIGYTKRIRRSDLDAFLKSHESTCAVPEKPLI